MFSCADGSTKQEGHVAPRPHRLRLLQQEYRDAGGDANAQRHPQLLSSAGGESVADDFFPGDTSSCRTHVGPRGQVIST